MNALANPEVGAYINKHFVSSFQKVATFRIVNGQKQGGNVASYFCAPDGRVLHCEAATKAVEESKKQEIPFKVMFRKLHAERLRQEHGLVVEVASFDAPDPKDDGPLSYRDPTGRPLMPVLVAPPIDGPDVEFRGKAQAAGAPQMERAAKDKAGRGWVLGNQGRVHQLMAAYSMVKIEKVYATVFQNILGEQVSTQPVITLNSREESRKSICLTCESRAGVEVVK